MLSAEWASLKINIQTISIRHKIDSSLDSLLSTASLSVSDVSGVTYENSARNTLAVNVTPDCKWLFIEGKL